jgi:hypothetical protein
VQALHDALFAERLEQVVDHTELERFERVPFVRRGEHEEGRQRGRGEIANERQPTLPARSAVERDVDENDVDPHPWDFTRQCLLDLVDRADGSNHLGKARGFEQLDEIVACGPLVFDDECA